MQQKPYHTIRLPSQHTDSGRPLRGVLVTNDDGPPSTNVAPFLLPFTRALRRYLDQINCPNAIVCVPAEQQSWIGKAVTRHKNVPIKLNFTRENWREQKKRAGAKEIALWALCHASPSSTANVGLHAIAPFDVDLVISGPNLGRNTGRSFCLSSGTIAAAVEGALSGVKSIALSFGFFGPMQWNEKDIDTANHVALYVIDKLWRYWPRSVDVFNVNIAVGRPLTGQVYATGFFRDTYGCLYAESDHNLGTVHDGSFIIEDADIPLLDQNASFSFAVNFRHDASQHPEYVGSDLWALQQGHVSVTGISLANGMNDLTFSLDPDEMALLQQQSSSITPASSTQLEKSRFLFEIPSTVLDGMAFPNSSNL